MPLPLTKLGRDVFAPVDASGALRSPDNGDAVVLTTEYEALLKALIAGSGGITLLPDIINAVNSGDGTADAVKATASGEMATSAYSQLITVNFTAANTGPMTISINDETPRPLVTNTGQPIPTGYVSAGMSAMVQIDGTGNYRLFSYGDAGAIQAIVEALLVSATAEADRAEAAAGAVASAPQWAFSSKAAAELFAPAAAPDFISLTGSAEANSAGGVVPFAKVALEPTDLPAPAKIMIADGSWYRHAGRSFELELGAKGDGVTDNSSFFEDLSNSMTAYAGVIEAARGVFKTNKSLVIPKNAKFVGQGKNRTMVTAKGSAGAFAAGAVVALMGGTFFKLPYLTSEGITRGSAAQTFLSAHGLSIDDLLLFYAPADYSGSPWRGYYRGGQYGLVASVGTTTTLLDAPILVDGRWSGVTPGATIGDPGSGGTFTEGGIAGGYLDVYRCDFGRGGIAGMTVEAPGAGPNLNVNAIMAENQRSPGFHDLVATGGGNVSMLLRRCFDIRFSDLIAIQRGVAEEGYGLALVSCQRAHGSGHFEGYRHGIATGADNDYSVACREIDIHDFTAVNMVPGIAAADWHGCTEYSSYRRGRLYGGGVNLTGNHNTVEDIEHVGAGMLVLAREMTSCDHSYSRLRSRTSFNDANRGVVNIGGNEEPLSALTAMGGMLALSDINIVAPNHTSNGVTIRNRGFTRAAWSISATDVSYDGAAAPAGMAALAVLGVSGNAPARLDLSKITPRGSANLKAVSMGAPEQAVTKVTGLREGGSVSGNTTTGIGTLSIPVTFAKPFPKKPRVTVTSNNFSTGADKIGAVATGVTATGFSFQVSRTDGTGNFSGGITVTGDWQAALDE